MDVFSLITGFLVMLNPFALFLYLKPVMHDLSDKEFRLVLSRATIISFFIFVVFLAFGDFLFKKVFQINFESFRVFGGVILFSLAYLFIVKGQKAFIQIKEDLDDLASEIALPFMVGAGTLSFCILMSDILSFWVGVLALTGIMIVNFLMVMGLKELRGRLNYRQFRIAFDKNMEVLMRINGFFVGAIGVDMIIKGIMNIFHSGGQMP